MSKYYVLDKPPGLTSKDFVDLIKQKENLKKVCYCGRLDPMARGQMIILGDEQCKLMNTINEKEKTYQFEICFGIQTDSDDPLGLIINTNTNFNVSQVSNKLINTLNKYNNLKFNQKFHRFSSININGKPYWLLTKENSKIDKIPSHEVTVYNIDILSYMQRDFNDFVNVNISNIDKINRRHQFRQDEIIDSWKKVIDNFNENIYSLKVEIDVTSGFYVRQFIQDLSEEIDFPFMVYDINRTKIST